MIRRRVLMVSCMFGALALAGYGLHRWPLLYSPTRGRFVFEGAGRADQVVLGTADYAASALLFFAGVWFRFRRVAGAPLEERRPALEVLDLIAVGACVLGGVLTTVASVGAIVMLAGLSGVDRSG